MSQALLIDARRFSRENRSLEGVLQLSELPRLADLLAEPQGEIAWKLAGLAGERGQPRLCLEVTGRLPLRCQRCLETVTETLVVDRLLELIAEDAEPTQEELEDDRLDFLPVGRRLDIMALVEDEILLSLPIVPRHEACDLPRKVAENERPHPFASLANLKDRQP